MSDLASALVGEYKTYFLILCLILIFIKQPSIGFFIGLILNILRINYTDKQYEEYDKKIYNQQLFRLRRGVRTASSEDAKIISDALSNGTIERSILRFTSFFGPVGVKRTIRIEFIFVLIIGILFISSAFGILYNAPYIKPGFVTYNTNNGEKLYISKYRVFDRSINKSYNKIDCIDVLAKKDTDHQLKNACIYITTTDTDMRSELQTAIESEAKAQKILLVLFILLMGFGWWLIIGYNNFNKLNKIVCDLKNLNNI